MTRNRVGRRNHYTVNLDLGFRHAAQRNLRVGPFLELLSEQRFEQPSGQPAGREAVYPGESLKDV